MATINEKLMEKTKQMLVNQEVRNRCQHLIEHTARKLDNSINSFL